MLKQKSWIKGFSLIELSIAIIILGILTTGILSSMKLMYAGRQQKETIQNLNTADEALKAYLVLNGHLPCPAARGETASKPSYGKSIESCLNDSNAGFQQSGQGTVTTEGRDRRGIRIGILPWRSIGLSDAEAVDGWGNQIQYAVTETLTDRLYYAQRQGAIDIVAEDGQSRLTPPASVQYVIFSTGPDGRRGFSKDGQALSQKCPLKALQTENCNDDGVFMAANLQQGWDLHSQNSDPSVIYDDYISYLQYDADLPLQAGIAYFYQDSCPENFSPVSIDKEMEVVGLDTLSQTLPGSKKHIKKKERELCYSHQYGTAIMILADRAGQAACPSGWDHIGYKIFNSDETYEEYGSLYYFMCAR